MLNVSENLKNILRNDRFPMTNTVTPKDLEITFAGMDPIYADQMVDDSFSLTESIIADNDIRFGTCRASQIKFKLANVPEDLKGREFSIDQLIGASDIISLGKYKVDSAKLQDDLIFKEVIAYDKFRDIDIDVSAWYNSLTFPMTLKAFRTSLLTHLGIDEIDQTLPNDDMEVTKTIEPTQISGRVVLEATVELNGAFGHINRQGKFTRIVLQPSQILCPSETIYPSDDLFPNARIAGMESDETISKSMCEKVHFEEYTVKPIDKLIIRSEEDDVGAIVGAGTNTYIIQGNFLAYGKTAEELSVIAQNVSANIFGLEHRPYTTNSIGLPYIEVGDALQFATGDTVVGYVLQRTLTGIQALRDEFEDLGNEEREQNIGANNEILQLQGKYTKIKKDVDGITVTVGDLEQNVSTEISQLADQIVLKVDANGNIGMFKLSKQEDGTQVLIKADNIELEGLITANGGFMILLDGSFKAVAGEIAGFDVVPEDEDGNGGLIFDEDIGKFIRISPYSSMDGQGGYNISYGAIDLGLSPDGLNTVNHFRSDGYARLGLAELGGSIRFNDYIRYDAGVPGATNTIFYSQNFQINRDGTMKVKSDDIPKALKSINVTKDLGGQISRLDITFDDSSSASLGVNYNIGGDISQIGDTVITYA